MHVTMVHCWVQPASIDAFIAACRENHENSVQEPGNRRFDVLRDPADPMHFVLYEAYTTADAAAAHKETAHYQRWRETVAPMMNRAREGVPFEGLFPP